MKTQFIKKTVVALFLSVPLMLPAAVLTWDAATNTVGPSDGSGTWDLVSTNWWNGSANAAFNAATPDMATFGALAGTAGTVTLGAAVISSNLYFNVASAGYYTIAGSGADTLTLSNATSILANEDVTISASIFSANNSLTISHGAGSSPSGVVILSGNNTISNTVNIGENANNLNNVGAGNTTCAVRPLSNGALGTGTIAYNSQGNQSTPRLELVGGITLTNWQIAAAGRNNSAPAVIAWGSGNVMSGTFIRGTGGQDFHLVTEAANGLSFTGATGTNGVALTSAAGTPRNYVLRGGGSGTVSGIITSNVNGSGNNVGIVKAGSGTWTFSGANSFAGGVIVNRGVLNLDYTTQNNAKLATTGLLTLGGGTVNLNGGSYLENVASTTIGAGSSAVTSSGGSSVLNLNAITRNAGGVIDFGAPSIAETATANVNGILGGYATVGGANWAMNSTGGANGPITAYSAYTGIAASGSIIANNAASNVQLNSAGSGGNITLGASTTTINTLLQSTTTAATIDTSSGTLQLGAIGGVLIPSGMQSLTFGISPNSGTLTAGGAANAAGELVLINNSANTLTVNSVITNNGSGAVSLTTAGSGATTLAAANTYTGPTVVAGGTLNVGADSNLGTDPGSATANNIIINGGTLQATQSLTLNANRGIGLGPTSRYGNGTISVASGQTLTYGGIVANSDTADNNGPGGSLTLTGGGTLVLLGANTYTFGTIINAGILEVTNDTGLGTFYQTPGGYTPDNVIINGGVLDIEGSTTLSANRGILLGPVNGSGTETIAVGAGQVVAFNGRITDNWGGSGSLVKSGSGTLILGGSMSDYSGNTTVSNGSLQLSNQRALPNGPSQGNVTINAGATLGILTNVMLKGLSGVGTVDNPSNAPVNLTLGSYDTSSSFGGVIQNSGGALSLTKVGAGTLTLSGANTYSGNTVVTNGGTLAITGSLVSTNVTVYPGATLALSGSGAISGANITIAPGATLNSSGLASGLTVASGQTLSSGGTVQGNLANSTGGALAPGGINVAGTLTINGNLTLNGSGFLDYDLTPGNATVGGGVNDLIVVNGNVTLNPGTVISVNAFGGGSPTNITYTILQYTGTLTGNPATALSINLGSHYTATFVNNTASSPKTITMIITGSPQNLVWSGAVNFAWDQGTLNWINNATHAADSFSSGDTVTFNNTGNSSQPINLTLAVNPNSTTVNGSSTYTFGTAAAGSLGGGALIVGGTATLILDVPGSYGSTLISGGTLQVGNNDGAGTLGLGFITNNATLVFNRTNTIVVTNQISGSGALTQSGTGDVSLNASNSFTGTVTVNSGRVLVEDASAMGTGPCVVNNGGQVYVAAGSPASYVLPSGPMTLNGSGPNANGSGALRKGGATTTSFGGTVTLAGDTTLNVDGNGAVLNLTNATGINTTGGNANLTLTGSGAGNITGPMSLGTGGITVIGTNDIWTLAPSNNYTGGTTINGGALLMTGPLSVGPVPASFNASQVLLDGGSLGAAANVTLDDGNIGITVSDNTTTSGIMVNNTNATFILSNNITGDENTTLTKSGPGELVLSCSNSYAGTLDIDTASTTANDGTTVIANNAAIANLSAVWGTPSIFIRNNNGGSSTLALNGTLGSIGLTPDISLAGRNVAVAAIENIAGNNTIYGDFTIGVGGTFYIVQCDAGTLTLATSNSLVGGSAALPYGTTTNGSRIFTFQGAGTILVPAVIQDGSANPVGTNVWVYVQQNGPGLLTLSGANTYTGTTVVSNGVLSLTGSLASTNGATVAGGLLVGTGTISGPVTVLPGGAIEAGATNTIGTLNLASNLTLSGNTIVKINKSTSARDVFNGQNSVTYGGTLTVTNLAGTLALGDHFTLFTPGTSASNFGGIEGSPGPGLAYSFTNGVLSVVVAPAFTPTNISFSLTGNTLAISWPAHTPGWILQSQTNSLASGLGTNWVDVAGSGSVTGITNTINAGNPTVFYRLRSQ